MAKRNVLQISKLENLKKWLVKDGWELLPLSNNPYEVLRASKAGKHNPLIIYSGKSNEHLSFADRDIPVIGAFIRDQKKPQTNADWIRSMTENEAIEELQTAIELAKMCTQNLERKREIQGYEMAIKALKEVQQYRKHGVTVESALDNMCDLAAAENLIEEYRAIGTPEECRAAVEKQTAKKPTPIDYEKYMNVIDNAEFLRGAYWCPNCNHVVKSGSFCSDCGQKLDWSDVE